MVEEKFQLRDALRRLGERESERLGGGGQAGWPPTQIFIYQMFIVWKMELTGGTITFRPILCFIPKSASIHEYSDIYYAFSLSHRRVT